MSKNSVHILQVLKKIGGEKGKKKTRTGHTVLMRTV
jgi:hypothetical protein